MNRWFLVKGGLFLVSYKSTTYKEKLSYLLAYMWCTKMLLSFEFVAPLSLSGFEPRGSNNHGTAIINATKMTLFKIWRSDFDIISVGGWSHFTKLHFLTSLLIGQANINLISRMILNVTAESIIVDTNVHCFCISKKQNN